MSGAVCVCGGCCDDGGCCVSACCAGRLARCGAGRDWSRCGCAVSCERRPCTGQEEHVGADTGHTQQSSEHGHSGRCSHRCRCDEMDEADHTPVEVALEQQDRLWAQCTQAVGGPLRLRTVMERDVSSLHAFRGRVNCPVVSTVVWYMSALCLSVILPHCPPPRKLVSHTRRTAQITNQER